MVQYLFLEVNEGYQVWVNYCNSFTSIKAIKGNDFAYSPGFPVRETSEVVIMYPHQVVKVNLL